VLAPIITSFPVGNRAFSANVSQYVSTGSITASENSGFIRLDHRFADSTNFFARFNIDQVSLSSPSGTLLDLSQTTASPLNGSLSLSHVFSPSMFNVMELGVNRIHALSNTDSHFYDTTKIFNSVTVAGLTKLNQGTSSLKSPTTYSLKNDFTWIRGAHTL